MEWPHWLFCLEKVHGNTSGQRTRGRKGMYVVRCGRSIGTSPREMVSFLMVSSKLFARAGYDHGEDQSDGTGFSMLLENLRWITGE